VPNGQNLRPRDIREGMSQMSTDTPRVRTSDAERERVAEKLRTAVGEGRLTLEEGDERLASLYTTKYRDELGPLVADLPAANDAGRRGRTRTAADEIWTPESEEAARYPGGGPGNNWPGWGSPGRAPAEGGPGWGGPWERGPRPAWFLLPLLPIFFMFMMFAVIGGILSGHFFVLIPFAFLVFGLLRVAGFRRRWGGWR
jgi:Domain of unknown function (DUF1707)